MTTAQLHQLLSAVEGNDIVGFFLVLARVAPLFTLAPLFSSRQIPSQVRGIIAVAIAIGLTGVATHGERLPDQALPLIALFVEQLLVGTAFAFALGTMFAALAAAGSFLDTVSGFAYGSLINPLNGVNSAVISQIYTFIGTMIFVAIGGDAWVLRGFARTYTVMPINGGPKLGPLAAGATEVFDALFVSAVEVAGPVMLALVITDIAFGLVSRVVPQLNVFAVGLPVKVAVALLLVAATLPFLGGWLTDQITNTLGIALRELQVA